MPGERSGDADPFPPELDAFVGGIEGAGHRPGSVSAKRLTGGVSSEIWKVTTDVGTLCVKRALPRLKVAEVWEAPVERNRYEARWYSVANAIVPGCAPQVLAEDDKIGAFAMSYFATDDHPVWKAELMSGRIDPTSAAAVGRIIGRLHAGTANSSWIASRFDTDALFEALRLSPYLRFMTEQHPDLAAPLSTLADGTAATHMALVHGDLSPKNILIGPDGPVILDAECAWYGDPAFDPAFCLTHLMLKGLWRRQQAQDYRNCFEAFWGGYLAQVDWEDAASIAGRAAALLPAIVLARVDGKSPVEYLDPSSDAEYVRTFCKPRIATVEHDPLRIAADWYGGLA
ncbi:phosphotransferase [Cucumibacter marinus]|uniref:phosphotransferase n=1 Tax=Cucumibacter marinus TaxID=1121252 RepID=UPI0003F4C656|nr:aminoglycoside phosphotransferase family protein [Cucumibacter marinus]